MSKTIQEFSEYTIQVVLATMPQRQEREFYDSVQKHFFENYRTEAAKLITKEEEDDHWYYASGRGPADKNTPVLYNPLNYFLMGNYDIAYISLIDNFKFAQRLFEPQVPPGGSNPDLFYPHTFQSFTGITPHSSGDLKKFFYEHLKNNNPIRKYFVGICNLKLNNGFLIGNGNHYLAAANELLRSRIDLYNNILSEEKKVEYLILQSFSWFELSVMLFTDDPNNIADIVIDLRRLSILDLPDHEKLVEDSLYRSLFSGDSAGKLAKANVFADTHTYIGIHGHLVTCDEGEAYFRQFRDADLKLKTEIEWHVKPGHMHLLDHLLTGSDKATRGLFNLSRREMLIGRSDYRLKIIKDRALANLTLLRTIMDKNSNIFEHVRKVRTRIHYLRDARKNTKEEFREVISLHQKLKSLAVTIPRFSLLDDHLKALKISRQIRAKVLKTFSNYNNGIQDIVLFTFLLDFKIFMERLELSIETAHKQFEKRFNQPASYSLEPPIDKLEDILMQYIEIFQEGYNIRMLNCYQFEDINDFDLDFNGSIPQLLSMYSTIAFEVGNLFYDKEYDYGPIVQLNLKDTVSNDSSINYYVHHLTSPEFVFATLTKEVLNFLPFEDKEYKQLLRRNKTLLKQLEPIDDGLADLELRGLVDLNYYLNDAIRFWVTYNLNFELFYYWFWTYNFQNASLYDEIGMISENHFEKELFRIVFLQQLFKLKQEMVYCPVPELANFWERHYFKIQADVARYIVLLEKEKNGLLRSLMNYILKRSELAFTKADLDCTIVESLINDARTVVRSISGWGDMVPLSLEFYKVLGRRLYAYQHLEDDPKAVGLTEHSVFYLQWYMYRHLKTIYEENQKKIVLLRRDWKTGKPLLSFLLGDDQEHLYAVDQTGGLFFDRMTPLAHYFKLSCKTLSDIWHYSQVRKKYFITKKLANK